MTRTLRTLLGLAAVAAAASAAPVAGAQTPQDQTQPRAERAEKASSSKSSRRATKPARRYRNVSAGEVVREGPRAHPRDYYGADDPRCDDLCQRERMMDEKYGKDRERLPGARRGS
jgi:hypothetical protein